MGKITINEIHKSLYNYAQAISDENLMTENKTIVGAINEIYGKQLIANAIGEPLNDTDTFTKMNNDINGLLSTFKTNMMNNGVTVGSEDKFKQLIDKIATLADNEGKGIQFAEGAVDRIKISDEYYKGVIKTIDININFNPTMIVVCADISNNQLDIDNISVSSTVAYDKNNRAEIRGSSTGSVVFVYIQNITQTSFDLGVAGTVTFKNFKWYAIGVGEEDTTLRDSLASILQDEGVEVTPEDDMASLITKVDEVFDNRKQILVNALVNEGLNAKITNTYEELITMISLLKYVPANSIINGNSTDSDFINGLTSYSKNRGDADSEITYSVSNNTIIVEGSADCVETTNGQADEGKRDLYIYNPSYTVDVTDYDVFKVIASYRFYDMEYGSLEVGLYTGSDFRDPVKTIENGDLDITDLTGEYHIVINAFVWNEYCLGETGILEGKVSYIGFE